MQPMSKLQEHNNLNKQPQLIQNPTSKDTQIEKNKTTPLI